MQRSWRDLGTPLYDPGYFRAIVDAFPGQIRVFVCRRNNEPVAVAFNGYFAGKVEGMWAGNTRAGHELSANYVLYWEMIKDACERGLPALSPWTIDRRVWCRAIQEEVERRTDPTLLVPLLAGRPRQ